MTNAECSKLIEKIQGRTAYLFAKRTNQRNAARRTRSEGDPTSAGDQPCVPGKLGLSLL